jgi:hypothetical protein
MSRLLLVPFPLLAGVIGWAYLAGDPARTVSPSFGVAQWLAHAAFPQFDPMHVWGLVFLAGAVALGVTLATNRAAAFAWALFVGGVIFTWWAALFGLTLIVETVNGDPPRASLAGWAIHGFIAYVHYVACYRVRVQGWGR